MCEGGGERGASDWRGRGGPESRVGKGRSVSEGGVVVVYVSQIQIFAFGDAELAPGDAASLFESRNNLVLLGASLRGFPQSKPVPYVFSSFFWHAINFRPSFHRVLLPNRGLCSFLAIWRLHLRSASILIVHGTGRGARSVGPASLTTRVFSSQ